MRFGIKGFEAPLPFSIPVFSVAFFFCNGQAIPAGPTKHVKDGPPVVKITAPDNNSAYNWNSLVDYSVVVSYQGKSTQYQEIPPNHVLIRTTYIPDVSKISDEMGLAAAPTPAGLLDIIRSNCVGCHEFKEKAMGPSFAAIAARYPDNQASMEALSRYIREGSTGGWGQGSMPPHTELTEDQLDSIVLWIVKDAANSNVNYYVGTDGAIRMDAPATPSPKGGDDADCELYGSRAPRQSGTSAAWRRYRDRAWQVNDDRPQNVPGSAADEVHWKGIPDT